MGLRILKRLFTPEEAELAMYLSLIAEEARVIARRANLPVEEVAQRLKEIEAKGLVFAEHKAGEPPRYMATHYIVGIFEFQVNKLDPELAADLQDTYPHALTLTCGTRLPRCGRYQSAKALMSNWR